jgi:hypothetical protein
MDTTSNGNDGFWGRRKSDYSLDRRAIEEWMEVLGQARLQFFRRVFPDLPERVHMDLRFDDDIEERLREALAEVLLAEPNITAVIDKLKDAGRLENQEFPRRIGYAIKPKPPY